MTKVGGVGGGRGARSPVGGRGEHPPRRLSVQFHTLEVYGTRMRRRPSVHPCSASRAAFHFCRVTQCMHATTLQQGVLTIYWVFVVSKYFVSIRIFYLSLAGMTFSFLLSLGQANYCVQNGHLIGESIFYGGFGDEVLSSCQTLSADKLITKVDCLGWLEVVTSDRSSELDTDHRLASLWFFHLTVARSHLADRR